MKKILAHVVIIVVLLGSWLPVANVFWRAKMPIGYDTSNFAHYVLNVREHPAFPVAAWKDSEFGGMSRLVDSTWLHFYLIQPLVSLIGFFPAVKLYPLLFTAGYLVFSYLLFFEISGNMLLSAGLTVLVSRSGATYVALYSSGVVLSFLSQTFYPMMLYFLVRFAKYHEPKSLTLAAVALAFGLYTHPGTTTVMTLPSALLFFAFWSSDTVKIWDIGKKLKAAAVFFITTIVVGALAIGPDAVVKFFEGGHQWLKFHLVPETKAFSFLLETINPLTWPVAGVAVAIVFVTAQRVNRLVAPFATMVVYFLLFQLGLWLGVNPLGGFVFPHRVYWMVVVSGLSLVAALVTPERSLELLPSLRRFVRWMTLLVLPVLLVASIFWPLRLLFSYIDDNWFTGDDFPYSAGDAQRDYGKYFWDMSGAAPSFFSGIDPTKYRFYALDYSHNITAGMATDLPQAKGVFAYSNSRNVNWFAWLDGVFESESILTHRIEPYVAEQQSLFLADWYAIRTLFSVPKIPEELAPWFITDPRPYIEDRKTKTGVALVKLREDATSPIIAGTNAKVIGFIGLAQGYDSFLRNLGVLNENSQYVIPIRLAEHLEDVKEKDLEGLDGLFIYSYPQRNKEEHLASWDRIARYIKNGGTVIVDTGSYAPEKYMDRLPDIFPMDTISSGSVGNTWAVTAQDQVFSTVNFSSLSPLTYEGGDWTMDVAKGLRPQAKADLVIAGNVVAAERPIGSGRLIWSGMNAPYRMHYFAKNAKAEMSLMGSLLTGGFGLTKTDAVPTTVSRPVSETVTVTTQAATGILFKENNYGGWSVSARSDGKTVRLPILSAGLDFMYVRLPQALRRGPVTVVWEYRGRWENWLFFIVSMGSLLYVMEGLVFGHRWTGRFVPPFAHRGRLLRARFRRWWEKEGN